MKKLMLQLLITIMLVSLTFTTSCSKEENGIDKPEIKFPEEQTLQLASGETKELSFSVNADWKLSISPTEASKWFFIKDGTHKVSSLNNKAGTYKVEIGVEEDEDFEVRSCEIVMTMGDKTQTIAKVTRGTIERKMDIYLCLFDEYGRIVSGKDVGGFKYEETPLGSDDIMKFGLYANVSENLVYREIAIKIVSNSDWKLNELPEWLEFPAKPVGEANDTVSMKLNVDKEKGYGKLPLEDVESLIKFTTENENNEEVTLQEIKLVSPGVRDLVSVRAFSVEIVAEIDGRYFNKDREQFEDLIGEFKSIDQGVVFYEMDYNNATKKYENGNDWLTVDLEWSADESTTIRDNKVSLTLASNEDNFNERKARVIAVPKSLADKITDPVAYLFNDDKSEVKEEFENYVVARVTQKGIAPPELVFQDPEGAKADGSTLTLLDENDALHIKYKAIFESSDFGEMLEITGQTRFYHLHYTKTNPANSKLINKEAFMSMEAEGSGLTVLKMGGYTEYDVKMNKEIIEQNPDKQYIIFFDAEKFDGLKFLLICSTDE